MPMPVKFTDQARQACERAKDRARRSGYEYVGPEHLLLGLLDLLTNSEARAVSILRALGADPERLRTEVSLTVSPRLQRITATKIPQSREATAAIHYAIENYASFGTDAVGTDHLLLGILHDGGTAASKALRKWGLAEESLVSKIHEFSGSAA